MVVYMLVNSRLLLQKHPIDLFKFFLISTICICSPHLWSYGISANTTRHRIRHIHLSRQAMFIRTIRLVKIFREDTTLRFQLGLLNLCWLTIMSRSLVSNRFLLFYRSRFPIRFLRRYRHISIRLRLYSHCRHSGLYRGYKLFNHRFI